MHAPFRIWSCVAAATALATACLADDPTQGEVEQHATAPPGPGTTAPPPPPPIDLEHVSRRLGRGSNQVPSTFSMWSGVEVDAADFWSRTRASFALTSDDVMASVRVQGRGDGRASHRYQQRHRGIPVEGAIFTLNVQHGRVTSGAGRTAPALSVVATPAVTEASARVAALAATGATQFRWEAQPNSYVQPVGVLAIYSPDFGATVPFRLVWKFDVATAQPVWGVQRVYVDAASGVVVDSSERTVRSDTFATGTLFNGSSALFITDSLATSPPSWRLRSSTLTRVHTMEELPTRTTIEFLDLDNVWSEQPLRRPVSAHWAAAAAWTHLGLLGMSGPDGSGTNGEGLEVLVQANTDCGGFGPNWDPIDLAIHLCNTAGPGPAHVDVETVAHEYAHAVTHYAMGGLDGGLEARALGEHVADAVATSVNASVDPTPDWVLFEESGTQVRNLANPGAQFHPKLYQGVYWLQAVQAKGEHALAGVANHWFYLLANGGSGTNEKGVTYDVAGIGREAALEIVLASLRYHLTPTATYVDYRAATITEALESFGEGSPVHLAAVEAWSAVGMAEPPALGTWRLPTAGTEAVAAWPAALTAEIPLKSCRGCGTETSWQVQVSSDPGFAATKTVTHTTSAVSILGTRKVVRATPDLKPQTIYYWRIRALRNGVWDATWAFTSDFMTSGMQPRDVVPAHQAADVDPWKPKLSWKAVSGATSYQVQMDWLSSFGNTTAQTTSNTNLNSFTLSPDETFYWRVRAKGPSGYGDWSTRFHGAGATATKQELERPWSSSDSLQVDTGDVSVEFVSPAVGAYAHPWPAHLDWTDVPGAVGYEMQLTYDDPSFVNLVTDELTSAPDSWTDVVVQAQANRKYYWRVRALGPSGQEGPWSNGGVALDQYFKVAESSVAPKCVGQSFTVPRELDNVTLDWEEVDGATGYSLEISRRDGLNSPVLLAASTNANTTSYYVDPDSHVLEHGGAYKYRVVAVSPDGELGPGFSSSACWFDIAEAPPCDTQVTAGGPNADVRTFALGVNHGDLTIHWRTFDVHDRITIAYEGATLWTNDCAATPDPGGGGTGPEQVHTVPYAGVSTHVTVSVQPNCNTSTASPSTSWDYRLDCP